MANSPNDSDEVKGQELLGSLLDRFFTGLGDLVHDTQKNIKKNKQAIDATGTEETADRETPTEPAPPPGQAP